MSRPLQILHVLADLGHSAASALVANTVAEAHPELAHHVFAFADGPLRERLGAACSVVVLPPTRGPEVPLALRALLTYLDAVAADVVHTYGGAAETLAAASAGAARRRPWVSTLLTVATARMPRGADEALGRYAARRANHLVDRLLLRAPRVAPAAITAASEAVRASQAEALGVARDTIELLRPGVSPGSPGAERPAARAMTGAAELRRELALGDAFPVVISIGPVDRNRGQLELVDVAYRTRTDLPNAVFVVVGDGPDLPELHRRIAQADVPHRFRVVGARDDVVALLYQSDLFVAPARVDGVGLGAMVALAAGVPVVGFSGPTTAVGELVEDGATGMLVPTGDGRGLARAVTELGGDPLRLAEFGSAARAASAQMTSAAYVDRLAAVYRRACVGPASQPRASAPVEQLGASTQDGPPRSAVHPVGGAAEAVPLATPAGADRGSA